MQQIFTHLWSDHLLPAHKFIPFETCSNILPSLYFEINAISMSPSRGISIFYLLLYWKSYEDICLRDSKGMRNSILDH